jgi:hypothetical protein
MGIELWDAARGGEGMESLVDMGWMVREQKKKKTKKEEILDLRLQYLYISVDDSARG